MTLAQMRAMLRAVLAISLSAGLSAYAADAFACSPSPSVFLVPVSMLSDPSRPIARDAGFYFMGEEAESYGGDSGFAIVVTDSSGAVITGGATSFRRYLQGARVLAWAPLQPLAANETYTIQVNALAPVLKNLPPLEPLPAVPAMRAVFTTTADLLPPIEIAGEPRVTLRTETKLPLRCMGPCAAMSGPCAPIPLLMADVEIPEIAGGVAEHGYQVSVNIRTEGTATREADVALDYTLIDARDSKRVAVQVTEAPEAVEVCVQLGVEDIARHTAMSREVCLDADTVAAALRGGANSSGRGATADSERHVSACAVAVPGAGRRASGAYAALLALAFLLLRGRKPKNVWQKAVRRRRRA